MTDINLAQRANEGELTVEEVNHATKEKLEEDKNWGCTVLLLSSQNCPIEVVEAILDKNVNIDELSYVSIVVSYILFIMIKLTLSNN
jgi:hypothetical protein